MVGSLETRVRLLDGVFPPFVPGRVTVTPSPAGPVSVWCRDDLAQFGAKGHLSRMRGRVSSSTPALEALVRKQARGTRDPRLANVKLAPAKPWFPEIRD